MTRFAKLKEVIKNRTPGPWHDLKMGKDLEPEYQVAGVHSAECKIYHERRDLECLPETFERQKADAEFIATVGTLADKMMAVIEAASHPDLIDFGYAGEHDQDCMHALRAALADLEAAMGEAGE